MGALGQIGKSKKIYLKESFAASGGSGPSCQACEQLILDGGRKTHIEFNNDPDGAQGYGRYCQSVVSQFELFAGPAFLSLGIRPR